MEKFKMSKVFYEKLQKIRMEKSFDCNEYINKKQILLKKYTKLTDANTFVLILHNNLKSAVGLCLLNEILDENDKIIPVYFNNISIADEKLCEKLHIIPTQIKSNKIIQEIKTLDIENNDIWLENKLTESLQICLEQTFINSLKFKGLYPVSVGFLTNTECGYLGHFEKNGEILSDIQLLSDINFYELELLARHFHILSKYKNTLTYLNIPLEEYFNTSFDFVELYHYYLNLNENNKMKFLKDLTDNEKNEFNVNAEYIETLHTYNKSKYFTKSSSVHLDIYPSGIKNGLSNYYYTTKKLLN